LDLLDPAERQLRLDWDDAAASVVGGLRQAAPGETHDPCLVTLLEELCISSATFAGLWTRADVGYRPAGTSRLRRPESANYCFAATDFPFPIPMANTSRSTTQSQAATSEKLALLGTSLG
jgi:hypothetical protein